MPQTEVYPRLTNIFREVFDDDTIELHPEMTANDIAEWDSFNHINLIVATETEFGIKFKTSEVEALQDVGHFARLIQTKLDGKR